MVGTGDPVAITWNDPCVFRMKVALLALVIAGDEVTVTVALAVTDVPAALVTVRVNVVVVVKLAVFTACPLVTAPTPLLTLPVPLVKLPVSVVEVPPGIVLGVAEKPAIDGAAITFSVKL
jgi:hypothetical protein